MSKHKEVWIVSFDNDGQHEDSDIEDLEAFTGESDAAGLVEQLNKWVQENIESAPEVPIDTDDPSWEAQYDARDRWLKALEVYGGHECLRSAVRDERGHAFIYSLPLDIGI